MLREIGGAPCILLALVARALLALPRPASLFALRFIFVLVAFSVCVGLPGFCLPKVLSIRGLLCLKFVVPEMGCR